MILEMTEVDVTHCILFAHESNIVRIIVLRKHIVTSLEHNVAVLLFATPSVMVPKPDGWLRNEEVAVVVWSLQNGRVNEKTAQMGFIYERVCVRICVLWAGRCLEVHPDVAIR